MAKLIQSRKVRGTSDELEIMIEIVKKDPYLCDRILTRIRELRQSSAKGILEELSNRQVSKDEFAERRRKS